MSVLNRSLDGQNTRMGLAHVPAKKFRESHRVPFTGQTSTRPAGVWVDPYARRAVERMGQRPVH